MSTPDYFYSIKPPGNSKYIFVTEETFMSAARKVGDVRPEPFVFIGDDENGDEWRGKKELRGFIKDRI